jgi:isopropylmalate/homocitrate/citramalate synthase
MPFSDALDVRICDSSLRDGSHAKSHQFSEQDVRAVVRALDAAGVVAIIPSTISKTPIATKSTEMSSHR